MIIRTVPERLRITLQTDHAMLSGQLASAWGGALFSAPEPLGAVRLAAELHDEGWLDWELEPRVMPSTGRPYDFLSLPPDQHTELYERGIHLACEAHPYAGLLVSLHGAGLYRQRHGYMPQLTYKEVDPAFQALVNAYLQRQQTLQDQLMADLQPDLAVMWTHYRWLQVWDLLSLHLCLSEPAERQSMSLGIIPLRAGGDEVGLTVGGIGGHQYTVSPWPFRVSHLDLMLPVRFVSDRRYQDDEDFRLAFAAAPTEPVLVQLIQEW